MQREGEWERGRMENGRIGEDMRPALPIKLLMTVQKELFVHLMTFFTLR